MSKWILTICWIFLKNGAISSYSHSICIAVSWILTILKQKNQFLWTLFLVFLKWILHIWKVIPQESFSGISHLTSYFYRKSHVDYTGCYSEKIKDRAPILNIH